MQTLPDNISSHELIEQNLDDVRRLVYGMLGNVGQVDDLVQEIFVRVIRGYAVFKQESSFQTWLYRIATRVVYDHLEKQKRSPALCPTDDEIVAKQEASDHALLRRERDAAIRAALETLSPSLRTTVVSFYFEDFSPDQIAAIEECSTSTIYWRLHEAKKQRVQL